MAEEKKEERKEKREKKRHFGYQSGGMACWAWISNSVFRAAVIAQNSGRMAREETVSAKSVTALETKTGIYIYYYPLKSASNGFDFKLYQSYLTE